MAGKAFTAILLGAALCTAGISAQGKAADVTAMKSEQRWAKQAGVPAALKRDVAAGNQEWIDGMKAGDAEKTAASYADDAVFCSATGDCLKGRAAIAGLYKDVLAKRGHALDAAVQSYAIAVDGDLAFESGEAEMRFADGMRQGRFSTVWKRQPDGHWRIFRNLSL